VLLHCRKQALAQFGDIHEGGAVVHAGEDEGKLVAPQPADDIVGAQIAAGAQMSTKTIGHAAQQGVAHLMAKRVIDLLELVQIDKNHREWGLLPVGQCQCLMPALIKSTAIRQPREGIFPRQPGFTVQGGTHLRDQPGTAGKNHQSRAGIEQQRQIICLRPAQQQIVDKP